MADIKYDISVSVQNALQALDKFNDKVQEVNTNFEKITGGISNFAAVAGAALFGLGAAAASFADELADVAAANETTIGSVLGLSSALAAAGGSADSVGRMFQTLNNNIDAANGGNMKMVETFRRLGITINELGTQSADTIRNDLIKAIADIKDPSERSAKAMEIFGKAAVGVDFRQLAADIDEQTAKYSQYENQIKLAGEAFDSMAKIIKDIKIAATIAFEPLFKYIANLKIDVDTLTKVIRIFAAALAAAVSVSVLAGFAKLLSILKDINTVVSKNKLITIIGAALAVGSAIGTWTGLLSDTEDAQDAVNNKTEETNQKTTEVRRNQEGILDAVKKQKESLSQVSEAFNRQIDNIKDKITFEQQALTLSEEQKRVKQEQNAIEQQAQNALASLKQKYDAMDTATRAARANDYKNEQNLIRQNAEAAKADVEQRIRGIQQYKDELKTLQTFIKEVNDINTARYEALAKLQLDNAGLYEKIDLEQKMAAIVKIRTALTEGLVGLNEEEKTKAIESITQATTMTQNLGLSYDQINKSVDEFIKMLVRSGQISQKVGDQILASNSDVRGAIIENASEIANINKQVLDQSRMFSTGWSKAFREYADNASNAATQARNIFQKMTQGMEDLIVNFAKTGKFEWKNFVNMMVEELMRSQIRQLMANIFNATGFGGGGAGGANGGSWLSNLLGFANGGIIPTNGPVLVGERGPEIISGAAGRLVTPNNQIGGAANVTYNIQAVDAMSFKQMIAQDPGFIYAVTQQGAKGLPTRR